MSTEAGKDYDEMEGLEKLERQVTALTKIFQTLGDKVKNQQIGQLSKIYASTEKNLKLDSHHHDLRVKQIDQQKKATIEAFAERQKEIRQTKALTKAMKQQGIVYDKVFKSIGGGGNSLVGAFNMMTGKLTQLTKTNKAMLEADKAFQKHYKKTGKFDSKLKEQVDMAEKDFRIQTFNSKTLQGVAGRLTKLADFMEKHQGKFLLGAGIASILIGIIGKALNVAPMFQAMFKLMQLAVNMILMPIGTFIGAMVKPFMLMVITTLAPLFQDAMKKAMAVGTAVGQFLMNQGSFAAIINALMLDTSGNGEKNTVPLPENSTDKTIDQVAGVLTGTAAIAATLYTTKKLIPVIGNKIGNFGANFFGRNNAVDKNTGTLKVGSNTPIYNNQGQVIPKNQGVKTNAIKNMGKVALPLLAFELLGGGEWLENFFRKGVRDLSGENDDHNLVFSQGKDLRGGGFSNVNFPNPDDTPTFEQMNALTAKLGITKDQKWMENEELIKKIEEHLEKVEGVWRIGGSDVERVGEILDNIGNEIAPMAAQNMVAFENDIIRMASYGYSSAQIMGSLAETYRLTDAQVKSQLSQISTGTGGIAQNPNSDAARAARRALAGYRDDAGGIDARQEADAKKENRYASIYDPIIEPVFTNPDEHNLLFPPEELTPAEKLEKRKKQAEEDAKKGYDKAYGAGAWEKLQGEINKPVDNRTEAEKQEERNRKTMGGSNPDHIYPVGFDVEGESTTIEQMEANIAAEGNAEPVTGYVAARGFHGMVNKPTMFLAGEAGAEHVNITPNGQGGGGGSITINIAKIEKNADFNQLKPLIQKWILEANSRRGMI
jgi:hypothetical protein